MGVVSLGTDLRREDVDPALLELGPQRDDLVFREVVLGCERLEGTLFDRPALLDLVEKLGDRQINENVQFLHFLSGPATAAPFLQPPYGRISYNARGEGRIPARAREDARSRYKLRRYYLAVATDAIPTRTTTTAPSRSRRLTHILAAPLYAAYTARLRHEVERLPLPAHVAVILDGNRRFASLAGLSTPADGHRMGADKLDELLDWCVRLEIRQVTVWALSNENLGRSEEEVSGLLDVVAEKLRSLAELHGRQSVRIRVYGRLDDFPAPLREAIRSAEEATAGNDGLRLNIALGYSGRDELVDAARALVTRLASEELEPEAMAARITPEAIASHLYTAGEPDPDLIIRTSGEVRLSGFLPWQGAHSELYFTDVYWPELRELDFLRALRTYQHRTRRFGR